MKKFLLLAMTLLAALLAATMLIACNGISAGGNREAEPVDDVVAREPELEQESASPFAGVAVGDHIEFGAYEQDGNLDNGAEPIEWRVLAVEDGRALLISECGFGLRYVWGDYGVGFVREGSDVYAWMNGDFSNGAFSADDSRWIDGGLFCLSAEEAEKFFSSDADRLCRPTASATDEGSLVDDSTGAGIWWLYSPADEVNVDAYFDDVVPYVDIYGAIEVTDRLNGSMMAWVARPAMWVDL